MPPWPGHGQNNLPLWPDQPPLHDLAAATVVAPDPGKVLSK
jgi:hypothetical protein